MPTSRRRWPIVVGGILAGGLVGSIGGLAVTWAIATIAVWTHPDDPSAGSAAVIVLALFPVGLLFGAAVGGAVAVDWCRKR
jgi:hypothetical protein